LTSDSLAERAPLRVDRVPLGILFMLGATVMFAVSSALSKWQVAEYSFVEVLFFRAIASLFTCAVLILPRTGLAVLRTNRLRDHFGRSATQATAQSLIIIAFGLMPLAGAVAINFSSPLFATLFAALWLKEKVGLARISALMAGFVGVLLVAAPGADSFRVGAMFALANAVLFGSVTAAVRGMTTTESAETLTMYQMIFLTLFFALPLPFFFAWPSTIDAIALIGNGVINAVGQYWWTRSLSLAPPSAVGPFYYFMLVWSAGLGFIFWDDVPTFTLIAGSAIVVSSGLFLLWHETSRKPLAADWEKIDEPEYPPGRDRPRRSGPRQGVD
jgi:drug/metabolite transporter (DMT)-like permease